ncbi:MAG: hypothetical protein EOM55_02965 [Clostridia bacterium]|nr:hypothetical protein [Clostridia bacterium]
MVAINPKPIISSTFEGLTVWAKIVLPSLFCYFILTKMLLQQQDSFKIFRILDKPFEKIFKTKSFGGYIFFMSILTGYPLGAKLIYEFSCQKLISKNDAKRMISFCSTSGPMFVVGSVAVGMFSNTTLGIVVFICHILSALINGLFYRNLKEKKGENKINLSQNMPNIKKETLNDIMFNTIISVLMIGGYISLCFSLMEFVTNLKIFEIINNFFASIFGNNIFESIIKGLVEVTNGCVSLTNDSFSSTILGCSLCTLISFGGLSIHLQSNFFLSKIGISYRYFLLTKITQTLIAFLLSLIVCIVVF